jgi:hypothetical protein
VAGTCECGNEPSGFMKCARPGLGVTQPLVQCVPGYCASGKEAGAWFLPPNLI